MSVSLTLDFFSNSALLAELDASKALLAVFAAINLSSVAY